MKTKNENESPIISPSGNMFLNKRNFENRIIPVGKSLIMAVPIKASITPRYKLSEPRVTISVGRLKTAIKKALKSPKTRPIKLDKRKGKKAI